MSTAPRPASKQATRKQAPQAQAGDIDAMVAEAAYYLSEKRGFCPGCELEDWLTAEAQIRGSGQNAPTP